MISRRSFKALSASLWSSSLPSLSVLCWTTDFLSDLFIRLNELTYYILTNGRRIISYKSRSGVRQLKEEISHLRLPRWLSDKESACQCRRRRVNTWARKILRKRKWQSSPVFLPGESHGQRSLAGYSPWDHKESDTTEHACMHWSLHRDLGRLCTSLRLPSLIGERMTKMSPLS